MCRFFYIVGRFVESFRKAGIRPGLYYSLWDRSYPRISYKYKMES